MKRLPSILILALFVLAACTSNAAPASPAQNQTNPASQSSNEVKVPAQYQYIFEPPADPFKVTPVLDESAGAEVVIGREGGSLSATGADGTVFRLDLPADALVANTTIRMIPLSGVDGMPFGSDPLAVQLEPEGLQLYKTAVLTITPLQSLPVDQQLFFGYSGLGENLVLVPPVVDSNEIKLQIFHFSGYGVTKGFLADIEPVRARIGGAAEQRIQSQAAELLTRARQAALLGNAEPDLSGLGDLFQAYESEVIQPRIAAAGESCAAGRLALQTILGYERQRQLLGFGEEGGLGAYTGLMDTVAGVCMKEEYEMCRDDHIIHRIIPAWLGLERQSALLGITTDGGTTPALEQAKDYVKRCLNFELVFHSEANFDDGGGGGWNSVVESKVKLQFDPQTMQMQATAPLVNQSFDFRVPGCKTSNVRGGDTFTLMDFDLITDTKSPTDELGYVRDLKVIYYPGNTKESYTVSCPDSPSFTIPPAPMWTGIFLVAHQDELSPDQGGFTAEDWEVLNGDLFARKEWIKDTGEGAIETGTFKLNHKPQ